MNPSGVAVRSLVSRLWSWYLLWPLVVPALRRGASQASAQAAADAQVTDWPVNAKGQTYGSEAKAKSTADVPDLDRRHGNERQDRILPRLAAEREPQSPKTAEEAETQLRNALCKGKVIPVYDSDGVTKIGVFQIGGPGCELIFEGDDGLVITKSGKADGSLVTKTEKVDGTTITKTEKADGTVVTKTVKVDGSSTTLTE